MNLDDFVHILILVKEEKTLCIVIIAANNPARVLPKPVAKVSNQHAHVQNTYLTDTQHLIVLVHHTLAPSLATAIIKNSQVQDLSHSENGTQYRKLIH